MKKLELFVVDAFILTVVVAVVIAAADWLLRGDVWHQLQDPWTKGYWLNAPILGILFALFGDYPLRRIFK